MTQEVEIILTAEMDAELSKKQITNLVQTALDQLSHRGVIELEVANVREEAKIYNLNGEVKTKSEKQLKKFLKGKKDHEKAFVLRPQGDSSIISKRPINICEIHIGRNMYTFGGISEGFYDKMVDKYHTN